MVNVISGIILSSLILASASSEELFDVMMHDQDFNTFLSSGSLEGFFSYQEFWDFVGTIRNDPENLPFISEPISIGETYQNRKLLGFYLTDDTSRLDEFSESKNILMLTSLHHAREPLSLTMNMLVIRECLKLLRSDEDHDMKQFFRDNVIFIIPIVNTDSYIYINENFFNKDNPGAKMVRKNRHVDSRCSENAGGVDLNRNYDFQFSSNEHGSSSNPCMEDYRGKYPFSEPETYAIKNFVDSHPNIVTGVNIHTFGNTWIYPFSFVSDKSNHYLQVKKPLFYDFYKEFQNEIEKMGIDTKFGNASFTLDYPTNGNSGDWLTSKKNILSLDVEIGNDDKKSEQFYPPRNIIADTVQYNLKVMRPFIYSHNVDFRHKIILFPRKIIFELQNSSISTLHKSVLFFTLESIEEEIKDYEMFWSIKNLMSETVDRQPVFNKEIEVSLQGRHILQVEIEFKNSSDISNVNGLRLAIKRIFEQGQKPNQIFYFRANLSHRVKQVI
jgi:hypothetical protein